MGVASRIVRSIISIVIGIIPLLYLGGYLSFLYHFGIPSPTSLLNQGGSSSSSSSSPLSGLYGILPYGGFSVTALIVYSLLSRVGGSISSAVAPRPQSGTMMSPNNFGQNPYAYDPSMRQKSGQIQPNEVREKLPEDMTGSQYVILKQFENLRKPKDVAKVLSMDRKEVEKETDTLIAKGYLSKNKKLTSKALDLLY